MRLTSERTHASRPPFGRIDREKLDRAIQASSFAPEQRLCDRSDNKGIYPRNDEVRGCDVRGKANERKNVYCCNPLNHSSTFASPGVPAFPPAPEACPFPFTCAAPPAPGVGHIPAYEACGVEGVKPEWKFAPPAPNGELTSPCGACAKGSEKVGSFEARA